MSMEHEDGQNIPGVPEEEKENVELVRELIIHLLRIYPVVSPTMLQAGLGPYVKPTVWRPVLQALEEEGIVKEDQETLITPRGRYNTYTKLSLA